MNSFSGNAYSWNFGDGFTSAAVNASHTYSSAGNYNINLTAISDSECVDSTSHQISIPPLPVSLFNEQHNLCDSLVTFTNLSTNAIGYDWDFGDGTLSSVTNPVHNYPSTGNYIVTLIANSQHCSDSSTI